MRLRLTLVRSITRNDSVPHRVESLSTSRQLLTIIWPRINSRGTLGNILRVAYQQLHLFPSFRHHRFPHLRQLSYYVLSSCVKRRSEEHDWTATVHTHTQSLHPLVARRTQKNRHSDSRSDVACVHLSRLKVIPEALSIRHLGNINSE